jgi:hypothetical protein
MSSRSAVSGLGEKKSRDVAVCGVLKYGDVVEYLAIK